MSNRIILHIGTEKTGTTTIQAGIRKNQDLLRENHIYPVLPTPSFFQKLGERQKVIKKNAKAFAKNSDVLISSELFQSRLRTKEQLKRLRSVLLKTFPARKEILVIVYLRRQAAIANSMVSTAAIYGDDFKQSPLSEYMRTISNHDQTMKLWSQVFGRENVIPFLFGSSLRKDSMFKDFVGAFKEGIEHLSEPDAKNISLSHDGILIAREVHQHIRELHKNGQLTSENLRRTGAQIIKKEVRKIDEGEKFMLHPAVWKLYDEEYKNVNKIVKEKYFPDHALEYLFEQDIHHQSESQPSISTLEARDLAIACTEKYLEKNRA